MRRFIGDARNTALSGDQSPFVVLVGLSAALPRRPRHKAPGQGGAGSAVDIETKPVVATGGVRPPKAQIGHFIAKKKQLLSQILCEHFRQNETGARELIALGAIYQNKKRLQRDGEIQPGGYLRVHLNPRRYRASSIDWRTTVVDSKDDYLIVAKPFGIPVHATVDNEKENCLSHLRAALGGELWVTQRLDSPVGGLLLLARTKRYQAHFNQLLADRKVEKQYVMVSTEPPALGLARHWMEPSERAPKRICDTSRAGYLECLLNVKDTTQAPNDAVFGKWQSKIELQTGRTHQIRAQLAFLGAPVCGDTQYGARGQLHSSLCQEPAIALWATELRWQVGKGRWAHYSLAAPWSQLVQ